MRLSLRSMAGWALLVAACASPLSATIPSIQVPTPSSAPHLSPGGCTPLNAYRVEDASVAQGTLRVTVTDANQKPVQGAVVGIEPEPVGCALVDFATGSTGASGVVDFTGLEVGPWHVHATKPDGSGDYPGEGDVTIGTGSMTTMVFTGS